MYSVSLGNPALILVVSLDRNALIARYAVSRFCSCVVFDVVVVEVFDVSSQPSTAYQPVNLRVTVISPSSTVPSSLAAFDRGNAIVFNAVCARLLAPVAVVVGRFIARSLYPYRAIDAVLV